MRTLMKTLLVLALAAGLTVSDATPVRASKDGFIAGIAAGVIGAAIISNSKKKKRSGSQPHRKRYSNPAVRGDANVQRALNAFGFDSGTPDGLFGKRTRAAIRRYQAKRGDEVSGYLTKTQKAELLAAYARLGAANSGDVFGGGGNNTVQDPNGTTVATVGSGASMASFLATLGSDATVTTTAFTDETQSPTTTPQQPEVPAAPLVVRLCDDPTVAQLAEFDARGGAENATNVFAQSFCTARSYTLANSARLVEAAGSFDPVAARAGCTNYANQQAATIEELLSRPAATVAAELNARMVTGTPEQTVAARNNFAVCLGLMQADGDMERALTYATLMVGVGDGAHGELVAEQYALGLGTPQDTARATDWLNFTVSALDAEAPALVDVDDYDHVPLLLALADSAPTLTQDAAAYLAVVNATPAAATTGGLGGMAFPSILDSGAAKKEEARKARAAEMGGAVGPHIPLIYGMDAAAALATCKNGEAGLREIGLRTCAALAWALQDYEFAEAMDLNISQVTSAN